MTTRLMTMTLTAFLCSALAVGPAVAQSNGLTRVAAGKKKRRGKKKRAPKPQPQAPAESPGAPEEPEEPVDTNTPWSEGVSADARKAAQSALEEGNQLFVQEKYVQALARYDEALAAWDHPTIRFNLARTQINMGRPVEAFDNLEKALKYGQGPLEDNIYLEAKSYRELLSKQIAELVVECDESGATVTLNGEELMTCPNRATSRILPGKVQLVAKKDGYLPMTIDLFLSSGQHETLEIELIEIGKAVTLERRWSAWKPWLTVGIGAAIAGGGGLLLWKSKRDFAAYDRELGIECANGCQPEEIPNSLHNLERRAGLENSIGLGTIAVGGAAVLTGLILVVLNQPRERLPDTPPPVVTATMSDTGIGLATSFSF